MFELSRTVRFSVNLHESGACNNKNADLQQNSFAGLPSMLGLGAHYEVVVACRGNADPVTGYLMNINEIDRAVRGHVVPLVQQAVISKPSANPLQVLPLMLGALQGALGNSVCWVRWRLTPYYSITMNAARPDRVAIRQQFEFAASHRLHCPSLSDEENRRIFGKCNNANGHGHNYRLEPVVSVPLAPPAGQMPLTLQVLERIVNDTIISRFDHKHLNLDAPEFRDLNPSVEHIAKVCYDLLLQPIRQAGGELRRITVWETEKTSCVYPVSEPE